jgi:hypothetical protein
MDAWMHGCMDAWMHGCMDAWMHGCMDAWMHGCMDAWMHGCTSEVVIWLIWGIIVVFSTYIFVFSYFSVE